jgi:hypothetical protein
MEQVVIFLTRNSLQNVVDLIHPIFAQCMEVMTMPLRVLYLDMSSFFASVEQQLRPELRGRPVAVVPMDVDSTCCIAASYQARQLGIRTGTPVWQARKCKGLQIVEARPDVYVRVHHQIIKAVESQMRDVWGGIVGQRWWHWLRAEDLPETPTQRSTVGHSHVLPPKFRTEQRAGAVLIRLIHKVGVRLRRINYWAGRMEV